MATQRVAIHSNFPLYSDPDAKSSCTHSFNLQRKGSEVSYEGLNRIEN